MQPLVQSTQETPAGPLELRIYPGDDCRGTLYQDDGHTFAYQRGAFLRVDYTCQVSGNAVSISSAVETGAFQPWWTAEEIILYGAAASPKAVEIDGQASAEFSFDASSHSVAFRVPGGAHSWSAQVRY
jgi:alpha-glucosidase